MDRLAEYALRSDDVQAAFTADNTIYDTFTENIDAVIEYKWVID